MQTTRSNRTSIASSDTLFASSVALLFVVVCGLTIAHHEMWRDELQAWLLARDSNHVGELLARVKYEGHPAFWYLLLFALTRFTHRPEAMQALHVLIAGAGAYVVARTAPFAKWARAAICFGYFPLYEYGVIARDYSLGLLFIFGAAAVFSRRRERPWLLGALLVLAAHTSVHALLIAAAMATAIALEPVLTRDSDVPYTPAAKTLALALAGCLAAAIELKPPPDSGFAEGWTTNLDLWHAKQVLGFFSRALLPMPSSRVAWGDLWLDHVPALVAPVLSIVLAALLVLYLARWRTALVMFVAGNAALFSFFYAKYAGSIRHQGFVFVNLIVALWLAESVRAERAIEAHGGESKGAFAPTWLWRAAAVVLGIHVVAAASAVYRDTTLAFSGGKATASLLVERGLDKLPLVGDSDFLMMSVIGYLDDVGMYYPRGRRFGTFIVLDQARHMKVTDDDVLDAARDLAEQRRSDVGIVLSHTGSPSVLASTEAVGCRSADLALVERYCVYRVSAQDTRR